MTGTKAKLLSTIAALATIGAAGSYGTYAAFSDTATNSGNAFSAGTLNISDGGTTSAIFALTNLRPGDAAVERCIKVVNTGSLSFGALRFHGTVTGALGAYLDVQVERGSATADTGGASASCTGFSSPTTIVSPRLLSAFPTSASPVDEGVNPAGWGAGAAKAYKITIQLPSSVTAQAAEGASANLTLTWVAES